jgi:hypothetical protein
MEIQCSCFHRSIILCYYKKGTVLYLNNNVVASSGSQTSALLANATAGGENTIGGYNTGSSSLKSFDGRIDQMRIYDTALDASDVAKLYNESSQIPTSNLIAHYKLDGNAEDVLDTYDGTETTYNLFSRSIWRNTYQRKLFRYGIPT